MDSPIFANASGPEPPDEGSVRLSRWSIGTLTYTKRQLIALFVWLLWGDFAWSMKDRAVSPVAQLVLKKFHASDLLMSLFIVALPAAIGMILGPIVSFRSDRTRGPWGRRIPYLAFTTPFVAISTIGLGFSPVLGKGLLALLGTHGPDQNEMGRVCFGIFWILFEISASAANAVFGALVNDVVPHEFLGRFYGLFRALSLVAGILFNYELLGYADAHSATLFLGVGLLYAAGLIVLCLKVKEGAYPPPDDVRDGDFPRGLDAARLYLKECFTNPFYVWLIMATVVATLVFLPVTLYSIPFAQTLHISMKVFGQYQALTFLISLCLSYALGYLADRFHPLRVGIVAMVAYAGLTLWGGLCSFNPAIFAIVFIGHGVLSGTYYTCTASLGQRLFPRIRYAQFASACGAVSSIANMAVAPLLGVYLDATGHMYRLTYTVGFGFAVLDITILLVVHALFMALGGVKSYVAPA